MADDHRQGPDVTQLLKDWSGGQRDVLDRLFPLVYDELRRMARVRMAGERGDHTLQATALVHEAFSRLVDQDVPWQNRAHFFGIAGQCMRRILVDYARKKLAGKRPPRNQAVDLDDAVVVHDMHLEEVLAVHEALDQLAGLNARQARIAEAKYFGGLKLEEIAELVGVSASTARRDHEMAKLWLHRALASVDVKDP